MRRKGIFTLLAAAFMVLAFTAVTFAANVVVLKTTVPNIPKSTCFQAGTDTMEMDDQTTMRESDVIQFTLNNQVTACKNLNMFMSLGTGALSASADLSVSASSGADTLTFTPALAAGEELGFVVRVTNSDSTAGQIMTLTLRKRIIATGALVAVNTAQTFTFNAVTAATDKLIIKLFDNKTTAGTAQLFKFNATTGFYTDAIIAGDNILCIDTLTQNYTGENVENNPDSLPFNTAQKLSFSGDFRIAHILGTVGFQYTPCAKALVGHIKIGVQGSPQGPLDTCTSFDFETAGNEAVASNGYCNDHKAGNKMIIQSTSAFEVTNYTVKMQIIVERGGVAKAIPGAYWSSVSLSAGGYDTLANACSGSDQQSQTTTYLQVDGVTAASPRSPASANCDLTAAEKAVTMDTVGFPASLNIGAGEFFLFFDLPPFNYDPAEILAGDVVKVRVTLTGAGCLQIQMPDFEVGTFGCALAPPPTGALLFPYFTGVGAGDWWNGIVIVNTGSTPGTATLTVHQKDGATGTFTTPVIPAGSLFVDLLENITFSGTGLGGNAAGIWIGVTTDGISTSAVDGFGMMAVDSAGEAMGYLPRK